jgi:ketosteroid isomerase-like protein
MDRLDSREFSIRLSIWVPPGRLTAMVSGIARCIHALRRSHGATIQEEIAMTTTNYGTTDAAEIRNLLEGWAFAVRNGNREAIFANHSADILMFDLPAPVQSKGLDAYRRSWDEFFRWFKGSGVFDLRELDTTAGSDVAFATALIRCQGTETNGDKRELDVRLTVGGGRWTIMHEHHSENSR